MAVYQAHNFRLRGDVCMTPTTKKLIRGLIYTVAMGIVSLTVIVEGVAQYSPLAIGLAYILGALLVFGVDIEQIECGPLTIQFEPSETRVERDSDDEN